MAGQTLDRWKDWAKKLKVEVYALYLTYKDPRVPWPARVFAACVVGYAFFSPARTSRRTWSDTLGAFSNGRSNSWIWSGTAGCTEVAIQAAT